MPSHSSSSDSDFTRAATARRRSSGNQNEDEADSEDEMTIWEVQKDGWMMAKNIARYDSDDDSVDPEKNLVQLPPDIAARGRVDARFSCRALVLHHGVWSSQDIRVRQ